MPARNVPREYTARKSDRIYKCKKVSKNLLLWNKIPKLLLKYYIKHLPYNENFIKPGRPRNIFQSLILIN